MCSHRRCSIFQRAPMDGIHTTTSHAYFGVVMDFMKNVPPETQKGVHVVVKVLPSGDEYRIYLLDARDESMRVLARLDRRVV